MGNYIRESQSASIANAGCGGGGEVTAEITDLLERQDDSLSVEERAARYLDSPEPPQRRLPPEEYWSLYPATEAELKRRKRAALMDVLSDGISEHTLRLLVIDFVSDQRHLNTQAQLRLLDQRLQAIEERGQIQEAV